MSYLTLSLFVQVKDHTVQVWSCVVSSRVHVWFFLKKCCAVLITIIIIIFACCRKKCGTTIHITAKIILCYYWTCNALMLRYVHYSIRMRQEDSEFSSKMNHIIGKLQHISWPFIDGDALDTSTDDGLDFESASQSALLVQVRFCSIYWPISWFSQIYLSWLLEYLLDFVVKCIAATRGGVPSEQACISWWHRFPDLSWPIFVFQDVW